MREAYQRALTPTEESAVQRYLRAHPFLIPLLEEARRAIGAIFGSDAPVRLEVFIDPEEGTQELFAIITTSLSPKEAYAALERLDQEWLVDASTQGRFNVDIEFEGEPGAV